MTSLNIIGGASGKFGRCVLQEFAWNQVVEPREGNLYFLGSNWHYFDRIRQCYIEQF